MEPLPEDPTPSQNPILTSSGTIPYTVEGLKAAMEEATANISPIEKALDAVVGPTKFNKRDKKQWLPWNSPSKTSKTATDAPASPPRDSDKQTRSSKKEFEEFKRLMLNDPKKRLEDLTYREVDAMLKDQPHEMAVKFRAAHQRAVLQRKGNSRLHATGPKTPLDEAVDQFADKTGLDPVHFPYEAWLKNDTVKTNLLMMLVIILLAFFAPFGVVYLGVKVSQGLKAMYPTKFSWLPL